VRFGAHLSTAGGLHHAARNGAALGFDSLQIFTKSPSQWRAAPLREDALTTWREALTAAGLYPVIVHDAYLINLAAPDPTVLMRSRAAFAEELRRAEAVGAQYLVTHLGAHLGTGEAAGLQRLMESLRQLLNQTSDLRVQIALETTAGQGTALGWRFEHLGEVLAGLDWPARVVVCLDTCHVFAAGYELRTPEGYAATMEALAAQVGLDRVTVIHANDSKKPLGSRVDRHAHVGQGEIGDAGFVNLLTDPRWRETAVIVETPESETMHAVNVQRLRELAATAR